MKFFYLLILAFIYQSSIFAMAAAADEETALTTGTTGETTATTSSSSTTSLTTVWVTTTLADGGIATKLSQYSQIFEKFYTAVATPSSGSIGLGSLKGTVGAVRTYPTVTLTSTSK